MRNQPHHQIDRPANDGTLRAWDAAPDLRLLVLFLMLCLPVLVVAARLLRLQLTQGEAYAAPWNRLTVTEEPIPARDGRLLTADGVLLAEDVVRFDILAHYRWIEDPPEADWLTQQAMSRLTPEFRRNRDLVEDMRQQVLRDREVLWERLALVTQTSAGELSQVRGEIQDRVERIVESVTRRREERETATAAVVTQVPASTKAQPDWWALIRDTVTRELTTPPRRQGRADPITVREELDYHPIATGVPLEVVAQIEAHPSQFPGVRVLQSGERVYPQQSLAPHLIGVRTPITPDELLARRELFGNEDPLDYRDGDRVGRDGVERAFEALLRGRRGRRRIVIDRRGELTAEHVVEPPQHGRDVVLTLDSRLQRRAETLLDEVLDPPPSTPDPAAESPEGPPPVGACAIVLDVWTGDLLAAAAAPRHNLQQLLEPTVQEWQHLLDDPRRPFFPRVTQMAIPPGSVFKLLTAAALLESGAVAPQTPLFCQGYLDRPDRDRCYVYRHYGIGHGEMSLTDALCQSCNVYFYQAARAMGPQPIHDWARRFGFGSPTGIDIPGERGGNLPDPFATPGPGGQPWYPGTTLQFAIGQASLTVTPLQIARMVAAIGNGGYLVTPRLVQPASALQDFHGDSPAGEIRLASYQSSLATGPVVERIPGLSSTSLDWIREGMRLVVQHDRGTGRHARIEGLPIAAKTGTAEVGGGKPDHAWFAGYFPADAPRYAFTIVLEHGGSGGRAAAPLAKQLIETMLDLGLVSRSVSGLPDDEAPR